MLNEARYEELKSRKDIVWIDVRSEGEYAESTIPGALSVPLFNSEERARIGTLYKQISPDDAKLEGLHVASAKLPALVEQITKLAQGRTPAIFCWRGGMRSKTVATVLNLMGIEAIRLEGGYRAYRQYVVEKLSTLSPKDVPPLVVIHGMTGVGKTILLRNLKEQGEPVFDLEEWADHRGSVFGGIGLSSANQRTFDSVMLEALEEYRDAPYSFIEAESKRIGNVLMPDFLFTAKQDGMNILLTASLSVRVERTMQQYQLQDVEIFYDSVSNGLARIERRFPPDLRKRVQEFLANRDYLSMVEVLLNEYYDPRYAHAMSAYTQPFLEVDGSDLSQAAKKIKEIARAHVVTK